MLEQRPDRSRGGETDAAPGSAVASIPFVSALLQSNVERHVCLWYPRDPRLVPCLSGPPPRQRNEAAGVPAAAETETPVVGPLVCEVFSRASGTRNAGLVTSAVLHFCILLGLSLLFGPLHLAYDDPLKLDLAVAPPELLSELTELAILEEELAPVRLDQVTPRPLEAATLFSAQPARIPFDGSGELGPRGTFFGTVAHGNRFVYVLDVSGSMGRIRDRRYKLTRLKCAIDELLYSVDQLREDQYFYVVLFSYGTRQMFDEETPLPQLIPATAENKRRLRKWLSSVRSGSGTDPRAALRLALQMKPSAVFLLSDGEFNEGRNRQGRGMLKGNPSVEEVVKANNDEKAPIHTIAYEDPKTRKRMEGLATQTGGEYRYIPPIQTESSK